MANDISLAVGDGRRRMTYAELAVIRGISAASAERLVRRRRWVRQLGNDGIVRVFVPLTEIRNPRKTAAPDNALSVPGQPRTSPRSSGADVRQDIGAAVRALETAVATLREQLTIANDRAERADRRASDAVAAERIAAREAAALRGEIDRRREWSLWRRLRWALRP